MSENEQQARKSTTAVAAPNSLVQFGHSLLCGGTGGAAGKTVTAPLERTKLLLQTQALRGADAQYKSVFDLFTRVTREQGFLSFWRGNGTNVMRIVPNAGLKWAFYDRIKKLSMPNGRHNYSGSDLWIRSVVAGSLSGGLTQLILYPMDFARTRLGADMSQKGQQRLYTGFVHCVSTIARQQGVRAIYAGLTPSLLGYMPYVGIKFSTYELMRAWIFPTPESHNSPWFPLQMMLIGATAGLVSKTAAYPMDTIRVRMQLRGDQYSGMLNCMSSIYRSEGIRGFYRGVLVNMMRAIPGAAVEFYCVETMRKWLF